MLAVSWGEVRAKRPPDEAAVAEHRARFDAEIRAHRLRFGAATEAALREVDDIVAGRVPAERYGSFDELLADTDLGE